MTNDGDKQQLSPNARRFTYSTWAGEIAEVYAAEVVFEHDHVVFLTAGGAIVLAEANRNCSRLTEHADDAGAPRTTDGYPASRRLKDKR